MYWHLLLALALLLLAVDASSAVAREIAGSLARAATPRLTPVATSSLPPSLQTYLTALHAAMRTATPQPGWSAATAQDCAAYALAYERALQLLPARAPNLDVWNALRLGPTCGAAPPPDAAALGLPAPWPPSLAVGAGPTFYVSPTGSDASGDGSQGKPFATVARGVAATRAARAPGAGPAAVVLRAGVHLLGSTLDLDSRDAGLTIANFPGEAAWVSGGAPLGPNLHWQAVNVSAATGANVWRAVLPNPPAFITGLNTVAPDGSPSKRLFRAQFPNFNPEWHATSACGGGARAAALPECAALAAGSPFLQHLGGRLGAEGRDPFAASGGPQGVQGGGLLEWVKPANFSRPQVFFHDLFGEGLKNNSAMDGYNLYSAGRGGACGLWTNFWGEESSFGWDYHCGNVTAGGWEEVDELMQTIGQLNIPVGLMYNASQLPNVAAWELNLDPTQRVNGAAVVNVWMTQGWFNNMFYVTGKRALNASAGVLDMVGDDGHYPSGGWQGGRHWQTRCSFQGCGPGGELLGGGWFVSNVAAELDSSDEYFFDPATNTLTLFYNASDTANGTAFAPPPASLVLMAPQLEVFFNLTLGAADVTIHGLGFRDQRLSYVDPSDPWVAASGGDWGLRPAGAVNFVGTERCTLSGALFSRTDANAVYLGGRNRNASVLDSEFVWLGMNAVASLGLTDQDDATGGEQPWGTLLSGLVARELALYEKQSSAYFVGRTPLSRLENSLFYNGPRAMVNVNDHLGGGNNFTTSLMFNACRESGDHGAMNSWDRMPFLTQIGSSGGAPSYYPALSETTGMFIIANYGSAQGYDNDDGSNHDHTRRNFFYQADGFKMDYGGSDSIFESNVVIVRPYDGQNCQNMWNFVPGHQDILFNNTCAVWQVGVFGNPKDADMVLTQNDCGACNKKDRSATPVFHDNRYYTTHGNASVNCGGDWGTTIADMQHAFQDFELRSTWGPLPDAATVIQWGRDILGM